MSYLFAIYTFVKKQKYCIYCKNHVISNVQIVNRGKIFTLDVLISVERIEKIYTQISVNSNFKEIDDGGLLLIPDIIGDQVHFREPS